MNDFWKWMDKKRYGYIGQFGDKFIIADFCDCTNIPKDADNTIAILATPKVLIPYMIEYLIEKDIKLWGYKQSSINNIYKYLKRKIEK